MTISQNPVSPLVVVVGAAGKQGSSVVSALESSSKDYRVRGFTRDPTKEAAKAVAAKGVELIAVDVSVENAAAVKGAFQGADIAFLMTDFWASVNKAKETADGKLLVDAAAAGGAKRILWSGLYSVDKLTNGKFTNVHHYESKAEVTEYGRAKFAGTETVFIDVEAGCYYQNFGSFNRFMFRKLADGTYVLPFPAPASTLLPMLDIRDYGKWVLAAIEDPKYAKGGDISAASEYVSVGEVARSAAEATGKSIVFQETAPDDFKQPLISNGFPESAAVQIFEGFASFAQINFEEQLPNTKISAPLASWKEFVATNNWSAGFQ